MADDLHDRLRIHPRIGQVCHGTMPEIVEHEVLDLLILAEPLHFSVGMTQLPSAPVEDEPLNACHAIQIPKPMKFSPKGWRDRDKAFLSRLCEMAGKEDSALLQVHTVPCESENFFQPHSSVVAR